MEFVVTGQTTINMERENTDRKNYNQEDTYFEVHYRSKLYTSDKNTVYFIIPKNSFFLPAMNSL